MNIPESLEELSKLSWQGLYNPNKTWRFVAATIGNNSGAIRLQNVSDGRKGEIHTVSFRMAAAPVLITLGDKTLLVTERKVHHVLDNDDDSTLQAKVVIARAARYRVYVRGNCPPKSWGTASLPIDIRTDIDQSITDDILDNTPSEAKALLGI